MQMNKYVIMMSLLLSTAVGNLSGLVGLSNAVAKSVIVQADGKVVVAGYTTVGGINQGLLVRYNSDGSLDTGFNNTGIVHVSIGDNTVFNGVIQQSDNKLVVVGAAKLSTEPQYLVTRYNTDGTVDTGFGSSGVVTTVVGPESSANAVAQQSDGKLVFVGYAHTGVGLSRFMTARINGNGTADTGFNSTGFVYTQSGNSAKAYAVKIQSDGKIVVVGSGQTTFVAMRCNSGGSIDSAGFGTSGISSNIFGTFAQCYSMALQSDGKIVLGGFSDNNFAVLRLTSAGVLDTTYGTNGKTTTAFSSTAAIYSLTLLSGGGVFAVGYMDSQAAFAQYTSGGVLDTAFNPGGSTPGTMTASVGSMARLLSNAVDSNGKIVAAGYSTPDLLVTRFSSTGVLDTDFGLSGFAAEPSACSTALCAYGQVYNVGEANVLNDETIPFDTNGALVGISHSTSSATDTITFDKSGTYIATYIVESPSNSNFQLKLNGNVISSSNYLNPNSSISVGKAIFDANVGDTLVLVNVSGFDQFLAAGGINASIILEKIA